MYTTKIYYLTIFGSVTKLIMHLAFTTTYRRKLFDDYMIDQLRGAFELACEKLECDLIEMGGESDHIHLLITYPPKLAISVVVNNLKSVSSRRIRILNTHLTRQSKSTALWSRSYFACSADGATVEILRAYRQSQATLD